MSPYSVYESYSPEQLEKTCQQHLKDHKISKRLALLGAGLSLAGAISMTASLDDGDYSYLVAPLIPVGIIWGGIFGMSAMGAKLNAEESDQALVYFTGDVTKAHFKETLTELEKKKLLTVTKSENKTLYQTHSASPKPITWKFVPKS